MAAPPTETRRDLDSAATSHRGDRIFNRGITAAAFTALLVLAGIAIFLGIAAVEAITTQGWSFLFTTEWKVDQGDEPVAGIWGMLYGSVLLAVIGLEGLVLTAEVVAGILNGSITAWEDPAITDANEGFDLSGLPDIEVYTVDQDRGSVQAMTTWLSEEAPQSWSEGTLERLPGNINFGSSFEMTEELAFMEGAVAVLPVFEAFNAFVPTAAFPVTYGDDGAQEELIAFPDDPQLAKIGSGAMALSVDDQGNIAATPAVGGIPDDEIFDLAASKIILQEDQPVIGWPVLGTGHLLVCDDPADPLPLSVAQYSLRLAGQGALETYGLTPLPEPVRIKTFEPLKVTVAGEN